MNPWYSLENKTIWVNGGAGYLGTPVVEALDGLAAKTLCIDRGERAADLVKQKGLKRTVPLSFDFTDVKAMPGFIEKTVKDHGLPDGVVHMVWASSGGKTLDQITTDDFDSTMTNGLTPTFLLCRTLANLMKPRGSGSIVLYSSMYGVVSPDPRIYTQPHTPNPIDYGVSKAGLLQMARYLCVHYGPAGLRFNCITPGAFPNPDFQRKAPEFLPRLNAKTALNRFGVNHEIVGPTLFLLTDSASYVTGHSLVVDGGWTAW
ncbi:MAG: SDR family oxidoreductase [Opitutaceae bacterium]|nr:SDR family oxidoreductase [Opitutaceae bacterium]